MLSVMTSCGRYLPSPGHAGRIRHLLGIACASNPREEDEDWNPEPRDALRLHRRHADTPGRVC